MLRSPGSNLTSTLPPSPPPFTFTLTLPLTLTLTFKMFWLKKFVSFWLMPLPFCLTLLVSGLWLTRSPKRQRLGRVLLWTAVSLLVVFSNKAVSTWLVRPLELIYPPVPEFSAGAPLPPALAACRTVVILGGGNSDTDRLSAVNKLSSSSLSRLTEGVRLWRALPGATLVVSGPGEPNRPTHASVLAAAAVSLGVAPSSITRIENARDTEEETIEVKRRVGREPFALVTSAWHLRRATALMRHAGLNPVPCPADFMARFNDHPTWSDYSWDTESLARSTRAVSERIGYLWSRLRGKL